MSRERTGPLPFATTKPTLLGELTQYQLIRYHERLAAVISRGPGAAFLLPVNLVDRKRGPIRRSKYVTKY
jgi:hypothetical protein